TAAPFRAREDLAQSREALPDRLHLVRVLVLLLHALQRVVPLHDLLLDRAADRLVLRDVAQDPDLAEERGAVAAADPGVLQLLLEAGREHLDRVQLRGGGAAGRR